MKTNLCIVCQRHLTIARQMQQGRCIAHNNHAKLMHGLYWSRCGYIVCATNKKAIDIKVSVGEWARECDSAWERDDIQELNRLRTLARYTPKEATQ